MAVYAEYTLQRHYGRSFCRINLNSFSLFFQDQNTISYTECSYRKGSGGEDAEYQVDITLAIYIEFLIKFRYVQVK